ncbi:hypothetical protein ENUP19_0082G0128 [Entamoeba nuttalli]
MAEDKQIEKRRLTKSMKGLKKYIDFDESVISIEEYRDKMSTFNCNQYEEIKNNTLKKYKKPPSSAPFNIIDYRTEEKKKTTRRVFNEVHTLKHKDKINKEIIIQFVHHYQGNSSCTEFQMTMYLNDNGEFKWLPKHKSYFLSVIKGFSFQLVVVNETIECISVFTQHCICSVINPTNLYITFNINNSSNQLKCLWTVCFFHFHSSF